MDRAFLQNFLLCLHGKLLRYDHQVLFFRMFRRFPQKFLINILRLAGAAAAGYKLQ